MYETLFTQIGSILEGVELVKDSFSIPKTKLTKFPCVFYKPAGLTSSFETSSENMKTFRFTLLVLVGANGTTVENAFGTVLPKVVDAVIAAFDSAWDGGTVDGHRVWCKMDTADEWQVSEEQDGLVCYAPLYLEVKMLTDI